MIELLIKKHQVNGIFYVSGSELENKDAKKREKLTSIFVASMKSLMSLLGFRDNRTGVCIPST